MFWNNAGWSNISCFFYYHYLHISKSRSHWDAVLNKKCFSSCLMRSFTEVTGSCQRPEHHRTNHTDSIIFTICVASPANELLCSQLLFRNGFTLHYDRQATHYICQWSERREVWWSDSMFISDWSNLMPPKALKSTFPAFYSHVNLNTLQVELDSLTDDRRERTEKYKRFQHTIVCTIQTLLLL